MHTTAGRRDDGSAHYFVLANGNKHDSQLKTASVPGTHGATHQTEGRTPPLEGKAFEKSGGVGGRMAVSGEEAEGKDDGKDNYFIK